MRRRGAQRCCPAPLAALACRAPRLTRALTCALALTLGFAVASGFAPRSASAEPHDRLRIASFQTELARKGPGLLLDAIRKGDAQSRAVAALIAKAAPDIIALQGIDYDHRAAALTALAQQIEAAGHAMPYHFALRPNSGLATGLDMDGDGRLGTARDAQGYGQYSGHGGMALLSRYPILHDQARDFSALLWADMPDPMIPMRGGAPFPSAQAFAAQRLSSTGHWAVPLRLESGAVITLLSFAATPPVFDGPQDRNGKRNHDELRFWTWMMEGAFGPAPAEPFVLLGLANIDPARGEGRRGALRALLADPRLTDPRPRGPSGDDATAEFATAGPLRLSYILPSAGWTVTGSGQHADPKASRHRLIFVDLALPPPAP